MSRSAHRIRALTAIVITIGLFAAFDPPPQTTAQSRSSLPPNVADLARRLQDVPAVHEDGEIPPPEQLPDPGAPVNALRDAQTTLKSIIQASNCESERPLDNARQNIEAAWSAFAAGSPDLTHLGKTTDALYEATRWLDEALEQCDTDSQVPIAALEGKLADTAARIAADLIGMANAASVRPSQLNPAIESYNLGLTAAEEGVFEIAIVHFGGATKLAADTVVFDVELFEQNINNALAGKTTGHAFSIAYLGSLYQGGESSGLARTAADAPVTAQSPNKEMHVASVSKFLTSIIVQRLLEEQGLTPDATVAPYLPSNWVLGAGVAALTFRDFMQHKSGFGQINAANDYQGLKTAIATDVVSTSFAYKNANYGLMRVLAAGLMGIDPVDYPEFDAAVLTASAFLIKAQEIYNPIGVDIDCASSDATPTVQYNFPDTGLPGYLEPNRQLLCGGYGWFISSNELASVLTHLRNTQNLLSTETRATMQEQFLGYMDPASYGDWTNGTFGVYYMHGGDWGHGPGELHACVVAFPIQVEVGLVINSEHNLPDYQCAVLRDAFDNAWVAQ